MQQTDLPLYPKTSSIYNKILQLGIATVLIVVLLNFSVQSFNNLAVDVEQQFNRTGDNFVEQAMVTASVLLKKNDPQLLRDFISQLPNAPMVFDARLYDANGQLIAQSQDSESINQLYGLELGSDNKARQLVPFIKEIRQESLLGYIRITLKKSEITAPLDQLLSDQSKSINLMLILAGLIGFLLTRGFSRFSRQSYRVGKPPKNK